MSRSYVRWIRRISIGAAVVLTAGFAVGSLVGNSNESTSPAASHQAFDSASRATRSAGLKSVSGSGAGQALPPTATDANGGPVSALGGLDLPGAPSTVIKTGDLAIEVGKNKIARAFDRVVTVAAKYGGFVLSSSQGGRPIPVPMADSRILPSQPVSGDGDENVTDVVIRIPAEKFELAVKDLTNGDVGKVTRRGFSGQDVGQEFVDLEARLRNQRTQEAVLLRLMSKATSIGDTIAVQQQLSQVQLQIEEISGRIRYLKSQTQLSTIAIRLFEDGAAVAGSGPSFTAAWRTAVDGLERMATAGLIAATWLSPFVVLGLGWLAARRFRGRPVTEA